MDITQDFADAKYMITGYKPDCVLINHEPYQKSFIIRPDSLITSWNVNKMIDLNEATLATIFEKPPEIMLLGSGEKLVLPEPRIIAMFAKYKIGLETMNSNAACRTYGILIAEGRKACAGIIIP